VFDITHALLGHTEVRDIKEKLCYVATSADTNPVSYECPNGKFITIDKERFQYTKVLFNIPSLSGMRPPGIRELCHQSIMQCSDEICKDLYWLGEIRCSQELPTGDCQIGTTHDVGKCDCSTETTTCSMVFCFKHCCTENLPIIICLQKRL